MSYLHEKNKTSIFINIILIYLMLFISASALSAEIIRLKDGQVINGTIVSRTEYSLVVKTRYQTKRISVYDLLSIEEEKTELQRLYILKNNKEIISGYLVEQDSLQVQYKLKPDSETTNTISKLDIIKMSSEEIKPVDLSAGLKAGIFYPINTGGANLSPSAIFLVDIGMSSIARRNLRFFVESGYTECENKEESERHMQIIPVLLNAEYRFFTGLWKLDISPRIGLGIAMTDYNSGENVELSGPVLAAAAGFKIMRPVRSGDLHLGIFADYMMLCDASGLLHSAIGGICIEYRL